MASISPTLWFLIAVALAFDFLNGLHDAANSIATVVGTRLISPVGAVAFAAEVLRERYASAWASASRELMPSLR